MLFLSLWEPSAAKPDNATLYRRCHEMGDMLLGAKLSRAARHVEGAALVKSIAPIKGIAVNWQVKHARNR
jgi:hypothetical protein